MERTIEMSTAERATAAAALAQKKVLNMCEAELYTGLSRGYLYKLTHKRKIPHSKPGGKMVFFEREKLDEYLLGNLVNG